MIRTKHAVVSMLALGLTLGACDSGDKGDKAGDKGDKSDKSAKATVADVFPGDKPALPAEVAAAPFGKPEKAVLDAFGSTYISSEKHKGFSYSMKVDKQAGLKAVEVSTGESVQDALTKQWGEPLVNKDGEAFWFNPEKGLRAWLPKYSKGKTVKLEHYTPLADFLGKDGKAFKFLQDKPILGATLEELHKAWGDALCNFEEGAAKLKKALEEPNLNSRRDRLRNASLMLCSPMFELTPRQERDRIYFGAHGKARRVGFRIYGGDSDVYRKQVIALLENKLGKPIENKNDKRTNLYFFDPEARVRVELSHTPGRGMNIIFNPYWPIKELFEGDGPGLAIEQKVPMIGKTFAEIEQADPTHYYSAGGETADLIYPPTEFNTRSTDVDLQIWAGKKKVHGYRVVVHYGDHPPHGEQVFDLLKTRFGEPKRDRKSTDKDEYFDFKKAGRKIRARRVSNQWQISVTK